jgi:hypothetical protein
MSVLLLLACARTVAPPPRPVLLPAVIDSRAQDLGHARAAVFASPEGELLAFFEQRGSWKVRFPDEGHMEVQQVSAARDTEGPGWNLQGSASGLTGACLGHSGVTLQVEDLGLGHIRATWCGQSRDYVATAVDVAGAPIPVSAEADYHRALQCLDDPEGGRCEEVEDEVLRARGADPRAWAVGSGPVYQLPCEEGRAPSPRPVEVQVSSTAGVAMVEQHAGTLGMATTQLSACAEEHWRRQPCADEQLEHVLSAPPEPGDRLRSCYDEVLSLLIEDALRDQLKLKVRATPAPR